MTNRTSLEVFSQILVINLDRRKDRWERICNHLRDQGVSRFQRVPGVDGLTESNDLNKKVVLGKHEQRLEEPSLRQKGVVGCLKSHYKALQMAREALKHDENGMVLILEDDCFFIENTNSILQQSLKELPKDWQFLMLGARYRLAPSFISGLQKIVRIRKASATHAYVVNARSCSLAIRHIEEVLESPIIIPVDEMYMRYQSEEAWYGVNPLIAGQCSDWSDIEGRYRVHTKECFKVGTKIT